VADYLSHIRKRAYSPYYPDVPEEPEPEPVALKAPSEPVDVAEPVAAPSFDEATSGVGADTDAPAVDYAAEFLRPEPQAPATGLATLPSIFNEIDPTAIAEQVARRTVEELKKAARVSQTQNQSDDFDLDEISNYLVAGASDTGMQQHFATTPSTLKAIADKIEAGDSQLGRIPKHVDTIDDVVRRALTDNVRKQFIERAGGDKQAGLKQYREFLGLYQDLSNIRKGTEIADLRESESALADEYVGLLFNKRQLNLNTIAQEALKKGRGLAGEDWLQYDRLTDSWAPGIVSAIYQGGAEKQDQVRVPGAEFDELATVTITPEEREEEISTAATGTLDEAILRGASVERLTLEEPPEKPPSQLLMPSADAQQRLASKEGARYVVYDDYTGRPISSYDEAIGTPHIGYGHAIQSAEERELFKQFLAGSDQQMAPDSAKKLFGYDIARHAEPLQLITAPATQQMLDAVHSMTYRLGVQSSEVRKTIELINSGDYLGAATQIRNVKPTHVGPANAKLERAISARHAAEADLFVSGGLFRSEDDSVSATPERQQLEEDEAARERRTQADYGDPTRKTYFFDQELPEDPFVDPSELRKRASEALQTGLVELDPIGVGDIFDETTRNPFISKSDERGARLAQRSMAALDEGTRGAIEVAAGLPMGRGFKSLNGYLMRQEQAKAEWADLTPQERADVAKEAKSKTLAMIADAKTADLWVSPTYTSYEELLLTRPPSDEDWSLGKALWGVGLDSPSFLPYMGSGSVLSPQLEIVGRDNDGNILVRQMGATLTTLDLLDAVPIVGQSYVIGALENFVLSPIESLETYGFNPVAAIHQAGLKGISERRNFVEVAMEMSVGGTEWVMSTDAGKAVVESFADSPLGDIFFDPEENVTQRILQSRDATRAVTSFLGAGVGLGAAIFYPFDGLVVGAGSFRAFGKAFDDLADLKPGVATSIKAQSPAMVDAIGMMEEAVQDLVVVQRAAEEGEVGSAAELKSLIEVDTKSLGKLSAAGKAMSDVRLRASEGARWVDRLDAFELNVEPGNLKAIERPGQVFARDTELAVRVNDLVDAAIAEAKLPTANPEVKEIATALEDRRKLIESAFTLHPAVAKRVARDPETGGRAATQGLYSFDEHIRQLRDLKRYLKATDDLSTLKMVRLQRGVSDDGASLPEQLRSLLIQDPAQVKDAQAKAVAASRGIDEDAARRAIVEDNLGAVKTLEEAMTDRRLFQSRSNVLPTIRHQLLGADGTAGRLSSAHFKGKDSRTTAAQLLDRLESGVRETNRSLSAPVETLDQAYQAVYFNIAARRRGIAKLVEAVGGREATRALRPRLWSAMKTFGREFAHELKSVRFGVGGLSANTTRKMKEAAADQKAEQIFAYLARKINEPYIARQIAAGTEEAAARADGSLYTAAQLEQMVQTRLMQNRELPPGQQQPLIYIDRPGFSIPEGLLDTRTVDVSGATKKFVRENGGFFSAFGKIPDSETGELRALKAPERQAVSEIVDVIARRAAGVAEGDSVVEADRKLTQFYTTGVREVTTAAAIQKRSKKLMISLKERQQGLIAEAKATGAELTPEGAWRKALDEELESGKMSTAELSLLTGLHDQQLYRLRQMVDVGTGEVRGTGEARMLFQATTDEPVTEVAEAAPAVAKAPAPKAKFVERTEEDLYHHAILILDEIARTKSAKREDIAVRLSEIAGRGVDVDATSKILKRLKKSGHHRIDGEA
jgi:GH24 family phage-related lysozyme (muramidase)